MRLDQRVALTGMLLLSIGHDVNKPIEAGQTQISPNWIAAITDHKAKETKTLFKQNCVKCHGVEGRGDTTDGEILGATDLTNPEWQERVEDQRLVNSITHGRGQMPSFEKKLSKDQIKVLAVYVRTFRP